MYKTVSEVPKVELKKIEDARLAWGLIFRDADEEDFKKVVCRGSKKEFTKRNLISEIAKIDSFPDYIILPSRMGDIHVVYYGRSSVSELENQKIDEIFKQIFGVVNYV